MEASPISPNSKSLAAQRLVLAQQPFDHSLGAFWAPHILGRVDKGNRFPMGNKNASAKLLLGRRQVPCDLGGHVLDVGTVAVTRILIGDGDLLPLPQLI